MTPSKSKQRGDQHPPSKMAAVALPTPPKSSQQASRRASPRGQVTASKRTSSLSPALKAVSKEPVTKSRSPVPLATATASASKKRKASGKATPASEDVLCPICDDVCTCAGAEASASVLKSGWSSPIIIQDSKKTAKKPTSSMQKEMKLDSKADKMAQYVLSEYYFSLPEAMDEDGAAYDHFESGQEMDTDDESDYYMISSEYDSDELDEILFELDEDEETARRMKQLLLSKVNSVIGPNCTLIAGSDSDSDGDDIMEYHLFDPAEAGKLVFNLPPPPPPTPIEGGDNLANLTPQVLAAISAAAKTLTAATQHYTDNPTVPFSRDGMKQVTFVVDPNEGIPMPLVAPLEELIDTSFLHGSSPPIGYAAPMAKRWDKIPISSFRKRRLSAPKVAVPANAIKQPPPDFSRLRISEPPVAQEEEGFTVILTEQSTATGGGDVRERRATIQVLDTNAPGTATQEDEEYWPFGMGDEEFYWLGEHFRTGFA